MKQRHISEKMLDAFQRGLLFPLLEAVKKDDTLDMELRGDFVNIYYRGGSIFKVTDTNNVYSITFNTKYCTSGSMKLNGNPSPADAVKNLPFYKQAMDWWFHDHPKYEREFQQVIARENNNQGKISNGTDYYIADIEFVDDDSRFDMVALKWLSKGADRKNTSKVSLALIEVKYGDGALKGNAGIDKHLKDFNIFLSDGEKLKDFCDDMSKVFKQKCEMGLVDKLKENQFNVNISPEEPEVIFIFANHDPESTTLSNILDKIDSGQYQFPIMIAHASNMGYGLYTEHIHRLEKNK